MNVKLYTLGGDDSSKANLLHEGIQDGAKDAIATITKYAVVGGIALAIGSIFVPKTIKRLKGKYL